MIIRRPLFVTPHILGCRYIRNTHALVRNLCHTCATAPQAFIPRVSFPFYLLSIMPSPIISRHPFPPDLSTNPFLSSHSAMKDLSPILFDDTSHFDSPISDCDQMIFGPLEFDEGTHYKPLSTFPWDPYAEFDSPPFITSNFSGPSPSGLVPFDHVNVPPPPPTNIFHDPGPISSSTETQPTWLHDHDDNDFYLSHWLNEPDLSLVQVSSSLPTTSRSYTHELQRPSSCVPFPQQSSQDSSPVFAALNALPRSTSPTTSFDDYMAPQSQPLDSVSPQDTSLQPPAWASHLWETSSYLATPTSPQLHSSPLPANPRRRRTSMRRDSLPGQTFQPSSAPSALHNRPVNLARSYSRRAESASVSDDRDATIRRKRRISDEPRSMEKTSDSCAYLIRSCLVRDLTHTPAPSRSLLKPPKLAPSAWQLYFTDWIQKQQASSTRKLNVAQAAKEAGQEYAGLSPEEKEVFGLVLFCDVTRF